MQMELNYVLGKATQGLAYQLILDKAEPIQHILDAKRVRSVKRRALCTVDCSLVGVFLVRVVMSFMMSSLMRTIYPSFIPSISDNFVKKMFCVYSI